MEKSSKMQQAIKFFFSPVAFAIGFLWPLVAQVLIATGTLPATWTTWLIAALIVIPFTASAQLRGSWLWIKS